MKSGRWDTLPGHVSHGPAVLGTCFVATDPNYLHLTSVQQGAPAAKLGLPHGMHFFRDKSGRQGFHWRRPQHPSRLGAFISLCFNGPAPRRRGFLAPVQFELTRNAPGFGGHCCPAYVERRNTRRKTCIPLPRGYVRYVRRDHWMRRGKADQTYLEASSSGLAGNQMHAVAIVRPVKRGQSGVLMKQPSKVRSSRGPSSTSADTVPTPAPRSGHLTGRGHK